VKADGSVKSLRIIMLSPLAWLISVAIHAGIALFFLMPAGGAALEEGSGEDTMVVEQGVALEGMAKLGEDEASIEAVEAPPVQTSAATPPPEEVKPVEDAEIISSSEGPEQETVFEPKPEQIKRPQPQQVATLEQDAVVQEQQSSGQARLGGDATAQSAYLGALRSHLERTKVNPRSDVAGTAVVHFVVDAEGQVISREIAVSSGHSVLDNAAMASIDKASPFPPMPNGLNRDRIDVSVPFKFSVR
jgi:protein TonB